MWQTQTVVPVRTAHISVLLTVNMGQTNQWRARRAQAFLVHFNAGKWWPALCLCTKSGSRTSLPGLTLKSGVKHYCLASTLKVGSNVIAWPHSEKWRSNIIAWPTLWKVGVKHYCLASTLKSGVKHYCLAPTLKVGVKHYSLAPTLKSGGQTLLPGVQAIMFDLHSKK